MDLESFSIGIIADKTLQAFGFHISAIGYFEEKFSHFKDVTNLELIAKPIVIDNPGQVVIDSKEEVVKKKNKHAAKKKEQLVKLYAFVGSSLSLCPKYSPLLLPYFMLASVLAFIPTLIPALIPAFVPALDFYSRSLTILLSRHMPAPIFCLRFPTILLPHYVPTLAGSAAFFRLVIFLFLIAEFQLFCYRFLICSVLLFFLDLYLSKYSNNHC